MVQLTSTVFQTLYRAITWELPQQYESLTHYTGLLPGNYHSSMSHWHITQGHYLGITTAVWVTDTLHRTITWELPQQYESLTHYTGLLPGNYHSSMSHWHITQGHYLGITTAVWVTDTLHRAITWELSQQYESLTHYTGPLPGNYHSSMSHWHITQGHYLGITTAVWVTDTLHRAITWELPQQYESTDTLHRAITWELPQQYESLTHYTGLLPGNYHSSMSQLTHYTGPLPGNYHSDMSHWHITQDHYLGITTAVWVTDTLHRAITWELPQQYESLTHYTGPLPGDYHSSMSHWHITQGHYLGITTAVWVTDTLHRAITWELPQQYESLTHYTGLLPGNYHSRMSHWHITQGHYLGITTAVWVTDTLHRAITWEFPQQYESLTHYTGLLPGNYHSRMSHWHITQGHYLGITTAVWVTDTLHRAITWELPQQYESLTHYTGPLPGNYHSSMSHWHITQGHYLGITTAIWVTDTLHRAITWGLPQQYESLTMIING